MRFSIEEFYSLYGQYDKTIGIYFRPSSNSFKQYGNFITGDIYYTQSERSLLQKMIENENLDRNDGNVKLKVHLPEISSEIKERLITDGFLASDALEVIASASPYKNKYIQQGIKTLPKPTIINVAYQPIHNAHQMSIDLNSYKMEHGYKLAPFEIVEHNASILFLYKEKLTPEDLALFLDDTTGEIRDDINYQYLTNKFLNTELTTAEHANWKSLASAQSKKRVALLIKEMQRSHDKIKELQIHRGKAIATLVKMSSMFKDQRLITSNYPVWLDYERFLHIFMRHVRETKVGERFLDKSVFSYEFKEILDLIKIIINTIAQELDEHFATYPEKTFFRKGEQALHFQGDFYSLEVDTNGRLLTFYKDERR